jgi:fumarate reductase subunit D
MSPHKIAAALALTIFIAFNIVASITSGFVGLWELVTAGNIWSAVIFVDLLIALSIILVWVWRDARRQGRNPIVYVIASLFTGSASPLVYLLVRDEK